MNEHRHTWPLMTMCCKLPVPVFTNDCTDPSLTMPRKMPDGWR
ncbi:hypothetical protein [Aeromonas popoffii]